MHTPLVLLKFIAKALGNAIGGGFAGDLLTETLPAIAQDAWDWWSRDRDEQQRRVDVERVAQATADEIATQVTEILREGDGDLSPADRQLISAYLTHVPASVRRFLRRPSDPSGTTVPAGLVPRRGDEMLRLLPPKLPRFRPGICPLPGVDWELEQLLGVGGFGEVWKARNPHFPSVRPVALKFCLDPSAAKVLRNEAAVLDRVMRHGRHPGIVPLLHTYLSAEVPCLEYEYVEGGDLAGLIQDWHRIQGGPTPQQAARVVQRLAEIIGFAHRLDPPIVHRDLKPANILVASARGGHNHVKIADFGIGGLVTDRTIREMTVGAGRGLPLVSAVHGSYTPLYASPQQARGAPPDPRDDIFALGVIWFQLMTGDLTAGRPGGARWARRLVERGMAPEMVDLLAACFEEDPGDRPPDAMALAVELAALPEPHAGEPPPAGGPKDPTVAPPPPIPEPKAVHSAPPLAPPRSPDPARSQVPRAEPVTEVPPTGGIAELWLWVPTVSLLLTSVGVIIAGLAAAATGGRMTGGEATLLIGSPACIIGPLAAWSAFRARIRLGVIVGLSSIPVFLPSIVFRDFFLVGSSAPLLTALAWALYAALIAWAAVRIWGSGARSMRGPDPAMGVGLWACALTLTLLGNIASVVIAGAISFMGEYIYNIYDIMIYYPWSMIGLMSCAVGSILALLGIRARIRSAVVVGLSPIAISLLGVFLRGTSPLLSLAAWALYAGLISWPAILTLSGTFKAMGELGRRVLALCAALLMLDLVATIAAILIRGSADSITITMPLACLLGAIVAGASARLRCRAGIALGGGSIILPIISVILISLNGWGPADARGPLAGLCVIHALLVAWPAYRTMRFALQGPPK